MLSLWRKAMQSRFKYVLFLIISLVNTLAYALDDAAIKINWGYQGDVSPTHWGKLAPDFAICNKGKSQSPINIPSKTSTTDHHLVMQYHPSNMIIMDDGPTELLLGKTQTIMNEGHSIQLNFPEIAHESIQFANKTYRLVQFHFHTPSENISNGEIYPLEIHFVHQGEHGQVIVIGVWAKIGKANPMIQKIINHLPTQKGIPFTIQKEQINPIDLFPAMRNHYMFYGSLTTPPCTEGLQWVVMKEPITLSEEQLTKLKSVIGNNARPVQSLHNRMVSYGIKSN